MTRFSLLAVLVAACTTISDPDPTADANDALLRLADAANGDGIELESALARTVGGHPCSSVDQQDTRLVYDATPSLHFTAFWRCAPWDTVEQLRSAFLSVAPGTFDFTTPDGEWRYSLIFPTSRLTNGVTIREVAPNVAAFDIAIDSGANILASRESPAPTDVSFRWDGRIRVTLPFSY